MSQVFSRRAALLLPAIAAIPADMNPMERPYPFKLSLAAYSFNKYLDLKKPLMTYEQFAEHAAEWGLGAVEITSYYIPDHSPTWLQDFKRRLTRLGLDVSGTATNNDFCQADANKRSADVKKVKEWMDVSAFLGAKTVRVFAGNTPKDDSEVAARQRCIECLRELTEYAAKVGIVVAVENHGGITTTSDQLLAIVNAIPHDWLAVNLDTAHFHTADPYADFAKVANRTATVQLKTEVQPEHQPKQPADFKRIFDILLAAKYRGYVALEYEATEDPMTAVPTYVAALQKLLRGES